MREPCIALISPAIHHRFYRSSSSASPRALNSSQLFIQPSSNTASENRSVAFFLARSRIASRASGSRARMQAS